MTIATVPLRFRALRVSPGSDAVSCGVRPNRMLGFVSPHGATPFFDPLEGIRGSASGAVRDQSDALANASPQERATERKESRAARRRSSNATDTIQARLMIRDSRNCAGGSYLICGY